jgi:hydroxymethylpyrimidine/phosphomethylpyrimidine kinase
VKREGTSYGCAPVVLSIAGHDPSGGAGIQADVEAIIANGCRAASAVTCLTVQNTEKFWRMQPVSPDLLGEQIRAVLKDLPVAAVKLGALGCPENAVRVADVLAGTTVPIVLDPVLSAGAGFSMSSPELLEVLRRDLVPMVAIATPNAGEAERLAGSSGVEASVARLSEYGCGCVLVTDVEPNGADVVNCLYRDGCLRDTARWHRLNGVYHGSGCTLASAIASLLARGKTLEQAVREAQAYTWNSLAGGARPGRGQFLPDRLYRFRDAFMRDGVDPPSVERDDKR